MPAQTLAPIQPTPAAPHSIVTVNVERSSDAADPMVSVRFTLIGSDSVQIDPDGFQNRLSELAPTLASMVQDAEIERAKRIIAAYAPEVRITPLEDELWSAQRRAGQAILTGTTWMTADEIGRKIGGSTKNPGMKPNRWKSEGRLFAVPWKGVDQYPLYAINSVNNLPWPALKEILKLFAGMDPWRIATWFESSNARLGDRKPREALDDQDAVVSAARAKLDRVDG
jgi:hypothetical protein